MVVGQGCPHPDVGDQDRKPTDVARRTEGGEDTLVADERTLRSEKRDFVSVGDPQGITLPTHRADRSELTRAMTAAANHRDTPAVGTVE